jgi:hypothetical protein
MVVTMTMPPDEISSEELYLEAKKMRGQLSAAVDELNELAAAMIELSVARGEDPE